MKVLQKRNVSLKNYSTFRVGGKAKVIYFPQNINELLSLKKYVFHKSPFILGNGSNVLFSDAGYRGVIICMKRFNSIKLNKDKVLCEAGTSLFQLCNFCAENNLSGLEKLYGIPGSVGGAIKMNAGAYGCEICDFVSHILVFKDGKLMRRKPEYFGYRKGPLQDNEILISAEFELKKGKKEEIVKKQNDIFKKRLIAQPYNLPSAGSVFKRGNGYFPAELIEKWGLKGCVEGGAEISEVHAGFIVNKNHASAKDIVSLIRKIEDKASIEGYHFEREIIILDAD